MKDSESSIDDKKQAKTRFENLEVPMQRARNKTVHKQEITRGSIKGKPMGDRRFSRLRESYFARMKTEHEWKGNKGNTNKTLSKISLLFIFCIN